MKHLSLLLPLLLLTACGEDRSHEYEALTQHNTWLLQQMQDYYLWADNIPEQDYKSYFQTSTKFFSSITSAAGQSDSWSYCLVDSALTDPHERGYFNHLDTYGLDLSILTDPTKQTSRSFARVTYVCPGSPAAQCGLQRGLFISTVDGTRITSSVASKNLKSGEARELTCHHIDTIEGGSYVWTDTLTVQLPASAQVTEEAFPQRNFFFYEGSWIAYLLCTNLSDDGQQQLDQHMQYFLQEQPTELVLDLRYCNHGSLSTACRLASCIVPPGQRGQTFAQTLYNSRHTAENQVYAFDQSLTSLELSRIFILTGSYTQGAAEWLIRGLQQALGADNVILIGSSTKGQNVLTQHIASGYGHQFFPAVAYVADGQGNYSYSSLTPTYSVSETSTANLLYMHELGDPRETLFLAAIAAILGAL